MNDELDGAQTLTDGSQVLPDTDDSEKKSADASETQSLAADLLKEILPTLTEATQKVVKEELAKQKQSVKDKRIYDHEDRIGSLEDTTRRLNKHIKAGKSLDEATDLVKTEVRQEQDSQKLVDLEARVENIKPGTVEKSLAEREQIVLQSLGLTANDPQVLAIQQKAAGDPDKYIEALEASWWDLKNKPRGKASEIAPAPGGKAPTSKSESELMIDYQAEMDSIKTTPLAGDVRTIQGIRKKYENLGLLGKI